MVKKTKRTYFKKPEEMKNFQETLSFLGQVSQNQTKIWGGKEDDVLPSSLKVYFIFYFYYYACPLLF